MYTRGYCSYAYVNDIMLVFFVMFAMLAMKAMVLKRWPKTRHSSSTICWRNAIFVILLLLIYSPFVEAPSATSAGSSICNTSKVASTAAVATSAAAVAVVAITPMRKSMRGKKRRETKEDRDVEERKKKKKAEYLSIASKVEDESGGKFIDKVIAQLIFSLPSF